MDNIADKTEASKRLIGDIESTIGDKKTDDEGKASEILKLTEAHKETTKQAPKAITASISDYKDKQLPPIVIGLRGCFNLECPKDFIAEDAGKRTNTGTYLQCSSPLLAEGDCAVIAAEGGCGKSFATLYMALLAPIASSKKNKEGNGKDFNGVQDVENVGDNNPSHTPITVAAGGVTILAYEDSPAVIYTRLKGIIDNETDEGLIKKFNERLENNIRVVEVPQAMMENVSYQKHNLTGFYKDLTADIEKNNTKLLIVDPATAALEGVSVSESSPVRQFYTALQKHARDKKYGILIVAHTNKGERGNDDGGSGYRPNIIAGSATWWDGARGVISMSKLSVPHEGNEERITLDDYRVITLQKSNYGETGINVLLKRTRNKEGKIAFIPTDYTPEVVDEIIDARKKKISSDGDIAANNVYSKKPSKPQTNGQAISLVQGDKPDEYDQYEEFHALD